MLLVTAGGAAWQAILKRDALPLLYATLPRAARNLAQSGAAECSWAES